MRVIFWKNSLVTERFTIKETERRWLQQSRDEGCGIEPRCHSWNGDEGQDQPRLRSCSPRNVR